MQRCLCLQAQGVELFEDHICKFVSYGEYLVGIGLSLCTFPAYLGGNEPMQPSTSPVRSAGMSWKHAAGRGHLQIHRV